MRLPDYDYSQTGVYYVTLVTKDRIRLFGDIVQGEMVLFGRVKSSGRSGNKRLLCGRTWNWMDT
jgi:hypothetical protein